MLYILIMYQNFSNFCFDRVSKDGNDDEKIQRFHEEIENNERQIKEMEKSLPANIG